VSELSSKNSVRVSLPVLVLLVVTMALPVVGGKAKGENRLSRAAAARRQAYSRSWADPFGFCFEVCATRCKESGYTGCCSSESCGGDLTKVEKRG